MKSYQIIDTNIFLKNINVDNDYWQVFLRKDLDGKEQELYGAINVLLQERETSLCDLEFYRLKNFEHLIIYKNALMFANKLWDNVIIVSDNTCEINNVLLSKIIYSVNVNDILQVHSSLIEHKGRGLMFLGPSGIGKTTQAELWNKYRDALIINGDIVFVQEKEECFLGWGTPWHGSSPYCENTSVPVHAMIVLKQAPENSIRELTGFEKVTAVSNSVFYPQWLENGMELCLETLDHLLSSVPVYELSCRPDEESVRLTEEAVFGRL